MLCANILNMKNEFMCHAIDMAKKAFDKNEIPVGAVIVKDGKIIASAYNKREELSNSLAHAEILAINDACKVLNSWRLSECDMYVTLEPCPMCCGAILQARIKNVYFGAYSKESGCMGTVINMPAQLKNSSTTVYGGIMEEQCSKILTDFFNSNI